MNVTDIQYAKVEKTQETSPKEQPEISQEMQASKRDRLELSNEYRSYAQENVQSQESDSSVNSNISAVTDNESTEAEKVNASELYSYTEYELRDLLFDGSITQSEYNAEIAKRES